MSPTLLAAIIGLLVIVLIVAIVFVVRRGITKVTVLPGATAETGEPLRKPGDIAPPATLRTALAIAMRELRVLVAGGRGPTDVPWTLVIGAGAEELAPLLPPPLDDHHAMGWLDEKHIARAGTVSFRTGGTVLGFEDGLVGQPQAERRLLELLREVEVVRPDRPIDSLLVALPWEFLTDADDDALSARGRQFYNLILAVQQRTGWRVPVYVLISGAEKLPGFATMGRAVLANAINPMVGWPAPKTLDSVFQPSWIDDAFDAIRGALSVEQLHVLMGIEQDWQAAPLPPSANDPASEGVLLLPARLTAAQPALKLLLTQMLENSVYHESFLLRGIFLTGDTEPPPPAPATEPADGAVAPPRAPQRLAQLLFLEKIFPEAGLAQPAYGELTRRHRMIRRTQYALAASVLLFVLGIGLIRYTGAHQIPPVDALLRNISTIEMAADRNRAETRDVLGACRDRRHVVDSEQTRAEFEENRRNSVSLLQQMSQLDLHRIETWLAPTSFFSGANDKIERAVKKSFHDVVFNAIADSMATPAGIDALISGDTPTENWHPEANPQAGEIFAGDFEGYWGGTLRNVAAYDQHFQLATAMRDQLPETVGILRGFAEVVQYSLGEQLPAQFTRNYRLYSQGITEASVPCLDTVIVQNSLDRIVGDRYAIAVRIYYLGNPVSSAWAAIANRLDPDSGAEVGEETLRELVHDIDQMATALAEPRRYTWIYATNGADLPMPDLAALDGLKTLRMTHLAELPARFHPIAEQQAQRLRSAQLFDANLLELDTGPEATAAVAKPPPPSVATKPETQPAGLPKLSAAAIDTRNFLRALFAQPFMTNMEPDPTTFTTGTRVGWDIAKLQAVRMALKNYGEFTAQGSGQMPQTLHEIALDLAARRFGVHADRMLGEAAQPLSSLLGVAQPGVDAGAANFTEALPLFVDIRDSLRRLGAGDVAARLDLRVAEQAGQLLADADRERDRDGGPYAVDDASLAAWDGGGSAATAAFGVSTIDDLKASLPQRRGRVSALARGRVAPLVAYLRDSQAANADSLARANRWFAITQTLDAYDGNSPNNTLTRLEQYMTVDLDRLDWRDWRECGRLGGIGARQGDYFAQQQAAIAGKLVARCRHVAIATIESQYEALRRSFNKTLAGRFPFSSYVSSPDAAPADVQEFFGQYGPQLQTLRTAIANAGGAGDALAVLDQLTRAQTALAPMLDAGEAVLTYHVDVDFFPRVPQAVGQSQLLGASIGTPDSLARDDGPGGFTWHNGEPVAVRLRWAANAPTLPMTPDGKCAPQPGGNIVGDDSGGGWALLRLLRARGPEPRTDEAAPGVPIAFEVPLCENRARASGGDPVRDRARIFLRLTLSQTVHTPDKPDRQLPVILPPFPDNVPELTLEARR